MGCGWFEPGPSGCDDVCGSTAVTDACGVCGGDDSSCADCCGVPNGNGDTCDGECGPCNDNIDAGACDCAGNIIDCIGVCGGSAEIDECGICEGPGATSCSLAGGNYCGENGDVFCPGNEISCPEYDECNDCDGYGPDNYEDCSGLCGIMLILCEHNNYSRDV